MQYIWKYLKYSRYSKCLNTHLPQKILLEEFKHFMPKSGFFEHFKQKTQQIKVY